MSKKTVFFISFVIVFLSGNVQTVLARSITLSGILRFDGRPMSDITDVSPTFWCNNYETGQAVSGITSTYDNNTGIYSVSGLPPAQVVIKVTFHIRGVSQYLPGNYNVLMTVEIPSLSLAQRTNYNMDLQQIIHMTSPWDNDARGPHTYPGDPYPEHNSRRLDFIWDAVPGATQYRIDIYIYRNPDHPDGYGRVANVVNSYVQETSFFTTLDFSNEFQHYQASILAFDSGGNVLGRFEIAYENGHGWTYRFKVVAPSRPISEPSLVGWWRFNDGSGTTAIDSSGNGFDIPLHNTTWEDGVFGGALHFHGLGHGYVENFNYSDNAITVCAWVWHDSFRIGEIERYVTVAPEIAVIRKDWDRSLNFYIKTDGNLRHLWGNDVLREGRWHHVAGTWDGLTQRLYIDGVEIANQVPGGVLGNTSNVEMCSEGESFNGMLDDVRIYNRALTQDEIQVIVQGEEFPYASNPYPADGAVLTDPNVTLSWEPGFGAILHYFYFGDDYDVVSNATGGMPWGASTYSPGTLDLEKTYYWRVDEVDGVTTYKGDVWSFSITTPLLPPESAKIFDDDFSSDSEIWTYVEVAIDDFGEKYPGSAYRDITNDYLVLTENSHSQCGVVWLNQDIFSPFTVEFKYLAGGSSGRRSADGLVFMFYKKKDYEPLDGGSLGFMTIPQPMTAVSGYGIEFDNYENDLDFPDPSGNHIALIEDSVGNHLVYRDDSRTEDNRWHDVRVTVGSSTIEVYVDNEMLFTWEGLIERTYGGIGFGAGTGSGTNGHLIDDVKIYKLPPPSDLSEALDTALSFTTGGGANWFSQTKTSYYGHRQDAAQSGDISHNQESWMQTTVSGAGTVSFYWKVSSEEDYDFLEFYINGLLEDQISGSVDWQQKTYTISTLGSHVLEWRYVKDKGADSGSDCGWVDKLEWAPTPPPPVPPPPPKGRGCFPADTPVWVNGALVQISNVVPGQMVGELHCDLATDCLEQIEKLEEHEGTFECRDIVLESGNHISVVDAHCFMLDSGQWIGAQDLRSGLRLKTLNGTVGIKSVATRAAPFVGKVYNLKIKGADQYFVGKDSVIVRDY